ncbi:MAG: hypothetical protein JO127_05850 [Caulobacteraceae bacterium]|nr:hypothetical protein [Caulobacteraceae bacterium]
MTEPSKSAPDIQGEGNYDAARRYRKEQETFARSGKVEEKAKQAEAALEGPEGDELEAARHKAARGEPKEEGEAKRPPERPLSR